MLLDRSMLEHSVEYYLDSPITYTAQNLQRFEDEWLADPSRPVLCSYMRCGRHWITAVLECYYQQCIAIFDTPWSNNREIEKILHLHGWPGKLKNLSAQPENVIVQYRKDLIAQVFSTRYRKDLTWVLNNSQPMPHVLWERELLKFANEYGEHLFHHLIEKPASRQLVYTFEDMQDDLEGVLRQIVSFLGDEFQAESFARVQREITKERVKDLSDRRAVCTPSNYEELRGNFRRQYESKIWEIVVGPRPALGTYLERNSVGTH